MKGVRIYWFFILSIQCIAINRIAARDHLEMHLRDPAIRAFLDTIAYAEGTLGKNGYRMVFGHCLFEGYKWHPNTVICANSNGKQLCSSAAGKYQFSQKMWAKLAKLIHAKDFSPINQERAAVYLLIDSGAMKHIKKGRFHLALRKVRRIWASIPGGPYNQPAKKERALRQVFKERLAYHKRRGYRKGRT
jgi:muramidase (phage lysozyme)